MLHLSDFLDTSDLPVESEARSSKRPSLLAARELGRPLPSHYHVQAIREATVACTSQLISACTYSSQRFCQAAPAWSTKGST